MINALKELGDFALRIVFDLGELMRMLQVPVTGSSTQGPDRMKALQLSAFVIIVGCIVWSYTTKQPVRLDPITIAVVTVAYLSASAWLVNLFLTRSSLYVANSDLKLDAINVVLAFNLIVVGIATLIRETLLLVRQTSFTPVEVHAILLVVPVLFAGTVICINSMRYRRRQTGPAKASLSGIGAFAAINIILADLYIYAMYVMILPA